MAERGRTRPIKVVRIIARLNIGGPAIQAVLLTRELHKESFSSTLITGVVGRTEGDMTPIAQEQGVQPLIIPDFGREISWKADATALWKLVTTLRRIRPDIVHTHTAKAGFLGRLAALWVGVPVKVHTFHGHIFSGYFSKIKTKLFLLLERWLARTTDRMVVVSESQRRELAYEYKVADEAKFQVVPLGFDLSPFEKLPGPGVVRNHLQVSSGTPVVGFIGRLVPIKNPFLFIEALALAKTHLERAGAHPDTSRVAGMHAVIVGGGELEDSLKCFVDQKVLGRDVTFFGWHREMAAIYADLDVVALTSNNEGTPVALIEAMASGRAFIATDVGGVRDLMCGQGKARDGQLGNGFSVYENGVLIPPNDARALASALVWVLANRDASHRMGEVGRQFALKRFGKERLIQDIQSLYSQLLVAKGIHAPPSLVIHENPRL